MGCHVTDCEHVNTTNHTLLFRGDTTAPSRLTVGEPPIIDVIVDGTGISVKNNKPGL